jgi:DNA-binding SARP family transcriptional activator
MEPRFLLLGFGEIHIGTGVVPITVTKPSVVLATLLLRANEPVSNERLHEVVWSGTPPVSARATLQTYVFRLRRMLARHGAKTCPIRTVPGGYLVDANSASLDILRFRSLVGAAQRTGTAGDLNEESRLLSEALSVWRGQALANLTSEVLQREEIPRLNEERLWAMERRIEVELLLGRHRGLISELRPLTTAFPRRERFWEQLVEALYQSGRQAEALDEYRKVRRILREDLGLDPGRGLQELELAILRGEPLPDRRTTKVAGTRSRPGSV